MVKYNIHRNLGDALKGQKIILQARQLKRPEKLHMTSGHRGLRTEGTKNAFAVIEVEFKINLKPKR